MSVKSEMDRITQNVANTYAALEALGADMPQEQNSDNLSATAGTAKVVLYKEQTLTDTEKAQARANIGAAAEGEGGGSVQTDWNQTDETAPDFLKNRPFGDVYGDTLTWDGNTDGLVSVDITGDGSALWVCVSDTIPTMDDLSNGATFTVGENEVTIIAQEVVAGQLIMASSADANPYVIIALVDNANFEGAGWTFPKAGVYTAWAETVLFPVKITIPGYTGFPITKKLDTKYLPGAVVLYVDPEYYMCADSSCNERITKAQLMEIMQSGRAVYCSGGNVFLTLVLVIFEETFGIAVINSMSGAIEVFTAEYVPEE